MENEYWYRFNDYRVSSGVDEYGDPVGEGYSKIDLKAFKVIKHTPKGVWLEIDHDEKRLVLKTSTKQWACQTKEDALVSFKARKKRQREIHSARMRHAKDAIAKANLIEIAEYPVTNRWIFEK